VRPFVLFFERPGALPSTAKNRSSALTKNVTEIYRVFSLAVLFPNDRRPPVAYDQNILTHILHFNKNAAKHSV
jgi:hypothetical protein